uniref:GTP-binding protein REM 2 n=1 Tax=Periophthalmus magnuspinnatus TaxID=409849 RepID=A0A3B3ZUT1_9GOBI
ETLNQWKKEDWRRRGSTPVRTTRPHRVLVQSASYQPGDSLRYRSRWLQELDRDLDWDLDRDLDQDSDQDGYRVVLIGDHDVGKSSLASVFAGTSGRDQEENQEQTFEKTLTVDGEDTTLRVMDTWDPNRTEQSLSTPCTAYILVYSVADRCTFEAAAELRITVRRARQNERVPIIIVGNKSDLVRAREVTTQEGLACAVVFDCKFIETSASLHHNVLELFEGVVRQIRLHRDTQANMLMLTLTPRYSHKRKESLTQKARRLLHRVMSNQRVSVRARSKSCHDLAVL